MANIFVTPNTCLACAPLLHSTAYFPMRFTFFTEYHQAVRPYLPPDAPQAITSSDPRIYQEGSRQARQRGLSLASPQELSFHSAERGYVSFAKAPSRTPQQPSQPQAIMRRRHGIVGRKVIEAAVCH